MRLATLALVGLVALAGCGTAADDGPASAEPGTSSAAALPSAPVESADTSEPVEVRIVPLGGDVAEIVYALGLGDDVVATDLSATYPAEVDDLPKIGFERALNAEPILDVEPTVVVATDAAGPSSTMDELQRVGVAVTIVEREFTPTGPADKIREVAAALGADDTGPQLADDVQGEIDDATVDPDAYSRPIRVLALYVRGTDLQFVLGARSATHWLIEAAGAIDVADDLGVEETMPITIEAILEAAPDVIIVPESGLESAGGLDALLGIAGIAETPAGKSGAILAYDDQLMLGNGPRTGQFLAQLVADFHAVDDLAPSEEAS